MFEILALALGALAGWLTVRAGRPLWLAAVLGVLSGMAVTALSGELELSAGFLVFDAGQAGIAALLAGVVARTIARPARGE
jgi:hypothetical protein